MISATDIILNPRKSPEMMKMHEKMHGEWTSLRRLRIKYRKGASNKIPKIPPTFAENRAKELLEMWDKSKLNPF